MEAGSKYRPLMLAPGNYVQWKSRIKRYIDTKPNHELIHYCLENPQYKLDWKDIEVLVFEGSPITTTVRIHETYKNVSQEIRDQLNAEAEAVQIILTGIDNDIYSIVDACPNTCEMWKAIERFYKMMKELIRNQCKVTNHQVNVQFLLQLQPEWQREKAIVNSLQPIYDQEPSMVAEDDETSKDKEIDKLMALISLSFKKIYKPTNNNLQTSSNTSRANQDNSPRINKSDGHVARECQKPKRTKDAAYHRKRCYYHELEAHYMYMTQLQEVSPDAADSGPIFDDEPLQKVSNNDHHIVFALESVHPEQSKPMHDTYPIEKDAQNVIIDSLDMSYDREEIDQNDDDNDLAKEREIDDFKHKNKSLESSNNFFKEANNKLSETNNLLYADYKKSEAELARRNSKEYASQMELECAKVRGDLLSYKMDYQKSCTKYTETINALNQTISKMKDKLSVHQETISILSIQKEAQIKLYKTQEDKALDKVIELENKVKVLDNVVYKTGQSVQMMNMLNNKCRMSFAKPEFLKKAQRANPRLYDIGCYNDNLASMLTPDSDEVISLEKESRSKINAALAQFQRCLNEEMIADLRYFNSLELEVDFLISQLETQKTQFLNEVDRLSREYYYADYMNAILGVYTELDEGNDLLTGYRGTDLYSITLQDTNSPNPICLMAKETLSQAWLWHRRLSHLNFDTINLLSKNDIVVGLPKLKFVKDHLCSSCEMGKAER
nr:copia protein [Tanacetum cinerariifolium]